MKLQITAAAVLILAGCVTSGPLESDIDLTGVIPADTVSKAEAFADQVIRPTLKDPASMMVTTPNELEEKHCHNRAGGQYKLWAMTIGINAKNSLGGFTGAKPYRLFFVNGEVAGYFNGEFVNGVDHKGRVNCPGVTG